MYALIKEDIDTLIEKHKENKDLNAEELISLFLFYRTSLKAMLKLGLAYKIVADAVEVDFKVIVDMLVKRSLLEFAESLCTQLSKEQAATSSISVKFVSLSAVPKSDEWKKEGVLVKETLLATEGVLSVNYKSLGKTTGFYAASDSSIISIDDFKKLATDIEGVKAIHDVTL